MRVLYESDSSSEDILAVQDRIFVTLETRDCKEHIRFRVDSGASVNVIPEKYVHGRDLEEVSTQLKMYNGTTTTPKGKCLLPLRNLKTQKKYSVEFVVVEEHLAPPLGKDTSEKMGLITVNYDLELLLGQVSTYINSKKATKMPKKEKNERQKQRQ